MKTIEINTAQNVTIQYELASFGNRAAAFFIDLIVLFGLISCLNIFFLQLGSSTVFMYLILLPVMLFYTLCSEILLDGQTIGKKAMGIKVVKLNGDPATAFDYLIRWAFRFLDIWVSAGSIAAMLISSSTYNQRLGCLLSGTTVIKKSSTRTFTLKDILSIQSIQNHIPSFPTVVQLSEQDMLFVKKVLERNKRYKNESHRELLEKLADKIADIIGVNVQRDKEKFLKTILADYIVLTR
jgi:uncharacterized RDD family membrane protein YckC